MTDHETLTRAADKLEQMAARASEGPWYASAEPMQGTYKYDVGTAFDLEEQDSFADVNIKVDADWIALMSPDRAKPLVALLRDVAKSWPTSKREEWMNDGAKAALAFARLVLGEEADGKAKA